MRAELDEAPLPAPNPIAGYEDWPAVRSAEPYVGADSAGTALGRVLGLRRLVGRPTVLEDGSRHVDGVVIHRLRWSVGYGGIRSVGAEQLVDLGAESDPRAVWLRDEYYSGRAPASELARQGYAVLVHDTFSWGQPTVRLVPPHASARCPHRGPRRFVAAAGFGSDR
jgi:hypothetical protein